MCPTLSRLLSTCQRWRGVRDDGAPMGADASGVWRVENVGFPLSILSPGFRIIRQPARRWLRCRESIPKLPRPPGLGQKECLQILLSSRERRVWRVENVGFPLSILSPGFRIVRQPAHRWLRCRESIPKPPRPPGLGQKEHLQILLSSFCGTAREKSVESRKCRLSLVQSESRLSYCPSARTPLVALSREHSKTAPAPGIGAERMS